ncbi:MAG: hypothetical protein LC104_02955 [Bacteroidales bacterium]|nr:hypothetical protein [Bacteroidales bacterium]
MQPALIIFLCVGSAIVYGIIHDQITARVCVEYFTIGHPPVFSTDDPTLLGLGWGIIATWWVGLILGLILVPVARFGNWPKRSARSLVRPVLILMLSTAILAAVAGVSGSILAKGGAITLRGAIAAKVPADRHAAFIACLFTHNASYLGGFVGGGITIAVIWSKRRTASRKRCSVSRQEQQPLNS